MITKCSCQAATLQRIFTYVASPSLKYTKKALSARLYLIPAKGGDFVHLTTTA
jgi:hypothetical protein